MKNEILHLEQFSTSLTAAERSAVTIKGYISDVELFVRWYEATIGEFVAPNQITYEAVRDYKQHLLDQQAKPNTINRRLASLASYTHWAIDRGLMTVRRNPVLDVKSVPGAGHPRRWLDRNERAVLLNSIEKIVAESIRRFPRLQHAHQRDATAVILLLNTGLHVHEIIALKLGDVTLSPDGGTVTVRDGKRAKPRTISLNEEARHALQQYLATRPAVEDDALFIGIHAEGINQKTIQRAINRFAEPVGLYHVTPLTCRHTFAKTLVDQGVPLEQVAALLGNTKITTIQLYATPDP
jgi:integrase/recombinase XerC